MTLESVLLTLHDYGVPLPAAERELRRYRRIGNKAIALLRDAGKIHEIDKLKIESIGQDRKMMRKDKMIEGLREHGLTTKESVKAAILEGRIENCKGLRTDSRNLKFCDGLYRIVCLWAEVNPEYAIIEGERRKLKRRIDELQRQLAALSSKPDAPAAS